MTGEPSQSEPNGAAAPESGRRADALLALAVARGMSLAASARLANVSRRTATRRAATPEFQRRVSELRAEVLAPGKSACGASLTGAVGRLRKLATSDNERVACAAAATLVRVGFPASAVAKPPAPPVRPIRTIKVLIPVPQSATTMSAAAPAAPPPDPPPPGAGA